jgi:two-component system, NtrC family, sensor kinase
MKRFALLFFCWMVMQKMHAQSRNSVEEQTQLRKQDSLLSIVNRQQGDTNEVKALAELAFLQNSPDSGIYFGERGAVLAKSLGDEKDEADCLYRSSLVFGVMGNLSQAIFYQLRALEIFERLQDLRAIAETKLMLQGGYRDIGDVDNALSYALTGEQLAESHNLISKYNYPEHRLAPLFLGEISKTYLDRNQLDSALYFSRKALQQNELFGGTVWNFPVYLIGRVQTAQGNYEAALKSFHEALPLAVSNQFPWDTLQIFSGLANLYLRMGKADSAIYYSKIVIKNRSNGETSYVMESIGYLADAYKLKGNKDSTIRYIEFRDFYWDSISNNKKLRDIQNLAFDMKLKQQESIAAQKRYQEKLRFYFLAAASLIILLVAIFLWRNIRQRQKAYEQLERQKYETEQQKMKTEKALGDLKDTQTQLIQSEKMASLGELTSGIAHEIQNPLNFVNNFSEVNTELIEELRQEMGKGNLQSAMTIAEEISKNEQKINVHGKRADAIVKGMLQHARPAAGKKEPADLNQLTEEYLRLAFLGMRTKEKSFQANIKTEFDPSVGTVNVVPVDIGRVLLNVFNNAFYALNEKTREGIGNYEPSVLVKTYKTDHKVEIRIRDNGNGISRQILDKIFQPFFTTKPPGQGTGLGLSLSYDIIKGHGGEIKVDTEEGRFTEFIISLPVNEGVNA